MMRTCASSGSGAVRLDALVERLALEQLHDDVRRAVFGLAVVVDLHHESRAELGGGLGLEIEALPCFARAGISLGDELHRDALPEAEVHGSPHAAHAPFSDHRLDAVLARDDRPREPGGKVLIFVSLFQAIDHRTPSRPKAQGPGSLLLAHRPGWKARV